MADALENIPHILFKTHKKNPFLLNALFMMNYVSFYLPFTPYRQILADTHFVLTSTS